MFKIGLKLWSINANYVNEAVNLYKNKVFDYIELYTIPKSYESCIHLWKDINIPFIIHAPHFKEGLNFAKKENKNENYIMAAEAINFADTLKAHYIIFHPGVNGDTEETIRQIKEIYDDRMLIENKPYFGNGENLICNGSSPEEIIKIIQETGVGFCLDIGHAICAANARKIDPFGYIDLFLALKPKLHHFTDGDFQGVFDRHDHYGKGSYPIEKILRLFPDNAMITNEAIKDSPDNLDDFLEDISFIRNIHLFPLNKGG